MNSVVTKASEPSAIAPPANPKCWALGAYGALALPLSLADIPILIYLPAFYAKELGLTASLVGLVFLLARFGDGFADVFAGWLSDRTMSRFGRRKPWVVAGAPLLILSTWFLFNPPDDAGLVYLCGWIIVFYASFTAVKIPHISWGTELASEYVQRSRVTTYREFFTFIGNLFFALVPLVILGDNAALGSILFLISITVLLTVPLATIPVALLVPDPPIAVKPTGAIVKGFVDVARDPVMVRFSIAILCIWIMNGMANSLAVFSFGVGLQLPNQLFVIVLILYVSTLAVTPLMMRLARSVDKHLLMVGGMIIYSAALVCHMFVPSGSEMIVNLLWVVIALGVAPTLILPTSILADIVDHGEVLSGQRRPGAYVATYNLVTKVGSALGIGIAFALLDLIHFDPSAASHGAADIRNILWVGFVLPALLLVPAIVILRRHPITHSRQLELRGALEATAASQEATVAG